MKIIREGDLSRITTVRRFECPDCGCIWDVSAGEYRREIICGKHLCPEYRPVMGEYLDYDDVMKKYHAMMKWLAQVYVNTLNIIHYMHDKYSYERLQMALHDKYVRRWFATGIAGFSVVADSLSAIKYAKVKVVRDERGIVTDYVVEGDFPKYGNDDDRVDSIANEVLHAFINYLRQNHTYRGGIPTKIGRAHV